MTTCTECGMEIVPGTKYLAGKKMFTTEDIPNTGVTYVLRSWYQFFWACEHVPAEDAEVRLASKVCAEAFVRKHPECVDDLISIMSWYQPECHHLVS